MSIVLMDQSSDNIWHRTSLTNKMVIAGLCAFLLFSILLGPGAVIPLFVSISFGRQLYRHTKALARRASEIAGRPFRMTTVEDFHLVGLYFIHALLPIVIYCGLLIAWYRWADISPEARSWLFTYFEHNQRFLLVSGTLYPAIERHYAAVGQLNILWAEVLAHIYAVVFNAVVLLMVAVTPSVPAYKTFFRAIAIRDFRDRRLFALFGALLSLLLLLILPIGLHGAFNAPISRASARYAYNVVHDDGFFKILTTLLAFPLGWFYFAAVGLAYSSRLLTTTTNKGTDR